MLSLRISFIDGTLALRGAREGRLPYTRHAKKEGTENCSLFFFAFHNCIKIVQKGHFCASLSSSITVDIRRSTLLLQSCEGQFFLSGSDASPSRAGQTKVPHVIFAQASARRGSFSITAVSCPQVLNGVLPRPDSPQPEGRIIHQTDPQRFCCLRIRRAITFL